MEKIVKTFKSLGDSSEVTYISDTYNSEYLDTEVRINNIFVCVIEGNKISEFHEQLINLISKYRI